MKVKVTKAALKSYWYYNEIGNVLEVEDAQNYRDHWSLVSNASCLIQKDDCEILAEVTLDKVNFTLADQSVEALETCVQRMQAHIEERKKPKPFTQKEFDDVLAKLRSAPGRRKYLEEGKNWTVMVIDGEVKAECWNTYHASTFGVWFYSENSARMRCRILVLTISSKP